MVRPLMKGLPEKLGLQRLQTAVLQWNPFGPLLTSLDLAGTLFPRKAYSTVIVVSGRHLRIRLGNKALPGASWNRFLLGWDRARLTPLGLDSADWGKGGSTLVRSVPSPISATGCPALFDWFLGTTEQSDSSGPFARAVRPLPLPAGLVRCLRPVGSEVSRFSCMQFLSVLGVYDYAGPARNSRWRC
jgi:hypothetical protein